jgi:hypothetical protein
MFSPFLHFDVIHRSGDDTDRQDAEISELADKLEDQKKQNRGFIEVSSYYRNALLRLSCILRLGIEGLRKKTNNQQFKAQERKSQRYRSKKKEEAFLKAIPILPVSCLSLFVFVGDKLIVSPHNPYSLPIPP